MIKRILLIAFVMMALLVSGCRMMTRSFSPVDPGMQGSMYDDPGIYEGY